MIVRLAIVGTSLIFGCSEERSGFGPAELSLEEGVRLERAFANVGSARVSEDGLWFADPVERAVFRLEPDGLGLDTLRGEGPGPYDFSSPVAVFRAPADSITIVDAAARRLVIRAWPGSGARSVALPPTLVPAWIGNVDVEGRVYGLSVGEGGMDSRPLVRWDPESHAAEDRERSSPIQREVPWPEYKSPIVGRRIHLTPGRDEVWVQRSRSAGETRTRFDVLDSSGERVAVVEDGLGRSLVGVGDRYLFLVEEDDVGLRWIWRAANPMRGEGRRGGQP